MSTPERLLKVLLRCTAAVMGVAVFPAIMPRAWMAAAHEWLGLGTLPAGILVEYLARSLSAVYAMLGGLMWIAARDVRRFAPLIRFVGIGFVALGAIVLATLWHHRSAAVFWMVAVDIATAVGFGAAVLVLLARLPDAPAAEARPGPQDQ